MGRRLSQHPAAKLSRARRKKYRKIIVEKLGGKCEKCGATKKLEPHHKTPRTWVSRESWAMSRLLRYLREIAAGVPLGLLCLTCNLAAGRPDFSEDRENPNCWEPGDDTEF